MVARALPRRDVRRAPARAAPLARRERGWARLGVRRRSGLRAHAPHLRADGAHRARAADPLPLAKAAAERRELDRREAGHLRAAGGGRKWASRALRDRGVRAPEPGPRPPGHAACEAARALAEG